MVIKKPTAGQRSQVRPAQGTSHGDGPTKRTLPLVIHGLIFDGDDTLWMTEPLYDDARDRAREIVERTTLDGARWEALERAIDVTKVATLGHSPRRFPGSCVEAYQQLCAMSGRTPDAATARRIADVARSVFLAAAPLRAHADKVLHELAARELRLILLTKGAGAIQRRRIAGSGLLPMFDTVRVVETKSPDIFRQVVSDVELDPARVLSVGNSIRSDVLPSVAAGLQAVWIPAHVWEYERAHDDLLPDHVTRIDDLDELLALVE